jgi:hypothetical protein
LRRRGDGNQSGGHRGEIEDWISARIVETDEHAISRAKSAVLERGRNPQHGVFELPEGPDFSRRCGGNGAVKDEQGRGICAANFPAIEAMARQIEARGYDERFSQIEHRGMRYRWWCAGRGRRLQGGNRLGSFDGMPRLGR